MKIPRNVFFLALGILLTMSHTPFAQDLTIRIDPQQTTVGISEIFSVDVVIENVTNLGAFQFDIVYVTDVVYADTALMGSFLGSTGRTVLPVGPDIDNTSVSGKLIFGGATFGTNPGPDGSGVLATAVFVPQAAGSTALELQNVQLADINGQTLAIDSLATGQVVVSPPAAVWVVTNTNDSGPGSLRWTIEQSNANTGPDTIAFNIPTTDPGYDSDTGVWTIRPGSALPAVTDDSTVIDGTTQTANQENSNPNGPEIEIDGTNAGDADGFTIYAANNVVKGLVINRFTQFGIIITYSSANSNIVTGNYIGTDPSGTSDLGNGFSGVIIYTGPQDNIIGGTTTAERNIISGNDWSGVEIQGLGADNNIVIGNYIGTDLTGSGDLGNSQYGINIWSNAQGNTVGGTTTEERNIISGNDRYGILIAGSQTDYNTVTGNYIGTNWDGTVPLPNNMNGIYIWGNHNSIGGTVTGEGNLISGNGSVGVVISRATDNIVAGNHIGTDVSGMTDLGNGSNGIYIRWGAQDNTIGPDNIIAYNNGDGLRVEHDTTTGNTITQNSITNNTGLGINNIDGGNTELSPPSITSVSAGAVSGTAPPNSTVEIFSDSMDEGAVYEATATADASGNFTWVGTPTGPNVTATATDAASNTSEFSAPVSTGVEGSTRGKMPETFELFQNYPNPFNPETQISFALPKFCHVTIGIYNVLGQKVKILVDKSMQAGHHGTRWDGKDTNGQPVSGGIYFVCMEAGSFDALKKAVFLK